MGAVIVVDEVFSCTKLKKDKPLKPMKNRETQKRTLRLLRGFYRVHRIS
jgi:hypothetical protein